MWVRSEDRHQPCAQQATGVATQTALRRLISLIPPLGCRRNSAGATSGLSEARSIRLDMTGKIDSRRPPLLAARGGPCSQCRCAVRPCRLRRMNNRSALPQSYGNIVRFPERSLDNGALSQTGAEAMKIFRDVHESP